ncbi:MAG: bifunctional diaminohydroxyphosphoribosylaminopyrimidine deaminase/5-amino-6-(5-phosphoribosylamino)uracil reductase RibD [Nevskiales bacterium]
MSDKAADARFMARALELAQHGLYTTHPNPRVGCVLVKNGEIVGEAWHERAGEPHAEVLALRAAGEQAKGATAYVTLEPCCHQGRTGPCTDALIKAGVTRVIAAMQDPNPKVAGGGLATLRDTGIGVESGLMQAQAESLNRGFISRMRRQRPWVRLKLAMSLDGRTAAANGESRWITGELAREDVHRLRAECGAVLTSSATVLADDPSLTVRSFSLPPPGGEGLGKGGVLIRQPDRIVLDARLRVPASAKVWAPGARRFVLTSDPDKSGSHGPEVQTLRIAAQAGRLDLRQALATLAAFEINEILVECGPRLAGALLQAKLVDELTIYVAPILLGDKAPGLAHLPDVQSLAQQLAFQVTDVRAFGSDWRIIATPRTQSV